MWEIAGPNGVEILSTEECERIFGKSEFAEIAMGYDPVIVACAIDKRSEKYLKKLGIL